MLDIKRIREDFDNVKKAVESRGQGDFGIDKVLEYDKTRRELLAKVEQMKNQQSVSSKQIPVLKKEGKDTTELMAEMKKLSEEIKVLDAQVSEVEANLRNALLNIPNTPFKDVQVGADDSDNVELRKWGEPRKFDFEEKAHWDIGADLDILDFERAAKIAGARFTVYKGMGARLERSVINFMLNLHTEEHGFTEILPPFMVNRDAMTGTGQLPKFEEDMFYIPQKDFFLIPTAEVPVTNIYRDVILSNNDFPVKMTAYTPCFRREAGSYGKDVRGLNRLHQFDKVEIVRIEKPENSYAALDDMIAHVEGIVKSLGLPYRILRLCGGDMSFTSAITYDFEVYSAAQGRWLEISSVSNFESYQANRLKLRYKDAEGKTQLAHTLNGSSLALPRVVAALLENNQKDGKIVIPEALRPYTGFDCID